MATKIFNEDCRKTIKRLIKAKRRVNVILTSPPYNTSEQSASACNADKKDLRSRYDVFVDNMSNEEYLEFSVNLFNSFDTILDKDGVVLYNLSYSAGNPSLIWETVSAICQNTPFLTADCIVWLKPSALPQNQNPNRLSRICEFVFVFCRKTEALTFQCNKPKAGVVKATGQQRWSVIPNVVRAPNNDGATSELNRATYSTSLCSQLLRIYAKKGDLVYDPFMGTGTTAVACKYLDLNCIGSELSPNQCKYAEERLSFKLSSRLF